jgi:hypothetical protein
MAHDMTVGGIGGLSYSLLSSRQPQQDVTEVLRRRLGDDVVKDRPKTGADHFSRTKVNDDQRLTNSLRQLADRYKTVTKPSAAPGPDPVLTPPATPATATTVDANANVPSLAPITTSAPALVVSMAAPTATQSTLAAPAPAPDTAPAATTSTDPATSMPVADTTSGSTTTTSASSGSTTTSSGSTTTSSGGKSATAPGHTR